MITNDTMCPNCAASTCWIFARSDRYHLNHRIVGRQQVGGEERVPVIGTESVP